MNNKEIYEDLPLRMGNPAQWGLKVILGDESGDVQMCSTVQPTMWGKDLQLAMIPCFTIGLGIVKLTQEALLGLNTQASPRLWADTTDT